MAKIPVRSFNAKVDEFFASPLPQNFSFPPDVILRFLKTNFSANGLLKIYQTCRYFFSKQRILLFTEKTKDVTFKQRFITFKENGFNMLYNKNNLYWFDDELCISEFSISHKITNIYRCTIKKLHIQSCFICATEFDILVSENTIKDFYMSSAEIANHGDPCLMIHEILQKLPNVTKIHHDRFFERYSYQCLQKLNNIKFWNKLEHFVILIANPSHTFDETLLMQFMEKNSSSSTKFEIILRFFDMNRDEQAKISFSKTVLFLSMKKIKGKTPQAADRLWLSGRRRAVSKRRGNKKRGSTPAA